MVRKHMDEHPKTNSAQMASPTYRLAALDQDFLLGESTRGIRFMLEYEKTEQALKVAHIASTIVVFGSARIREDGPGTGRGAPLLGEHTAEILAEIAGASARGRAAG